MSTALDERRVVAIRLPWPSIYDGTLTIDQIANFAGVAPQNLRAITAEDVDETVVPPGIYCAVATAKSEDRAQDLASRAEAVGAIAVICSTWPSEIDWTGATDFPDEGVVVLPLQTSPERVH